MKFPVHDQNDMAAAAKHANAHPRFTCKLQNVIFTIAVGVKMTQCNVKMTLGAKMGKMCHFDTKRGVFSPVGRKAGAAGSMCGEAAQKGPVLARRTREPAQSAQLWPEGPAGRRSRPICSARVIVCGFWKRVRCRRIVLITRSICI